MQRKEELDKRKRQIAKESKKALAMASNAGGDTGEGSADGLPFDELNVSVDEKAVGA